METNGIFFLGRMWKHIGFLCFLCETSFLWVLAPLDEDGPWCTHYGLGCLKSWSCMWCGNSLSLVCFIPMSETVNSLWSLPSFVMSFVFDFVATIKICEVDIHTLYVDLVFAFNDDIFRGFHGLVETNHDNLCMKWIIDLHIEIDHLGFEFNG